MLELILIVLALIACNAFFALSEMSVVTSRKPRLKQMASQHRAARAALDLAEQSAAAGPMRARAMTAGIIATTTMYIGRMSK